MNRLSIIGVVGALLAAGTAVIVGGGSAQAATLNLTPTADTYVQADQPTVNFGTSVRWSTEGRANIWRNSLLRFQVQVPAGEEVKSAKLRAVSEAAATATEFVDVYTTAGGWTETGVTWQNAPARDTWLTKAGGFANGATVEWDVTGGVAKTGGEVNLKLESGAQKWIGFKSKENATAALRPVLVVETGPATPPPPPPGDGTTAAGTLGWGTPVAGDEFNYTGAADPAKWSVYDSAGHNGQGLRKPSQVAVDGSKLAISGTADGTTGGMSAKFGSRKFGRWESRIALPAGDNEYHGVGILWPDSGNWPCDGEIDYMENLGDRSVQHFFQHYSCTNQQASAQKAVDATQFHNYAVEWNDKGITGYLDGVKWFEDLDPAHLPPGPMHQTLQLDWFPDGTADGTAQMQVDWVRVYDLAPTPPPTTTTTTPPPTTTTTTPPPPPPGGVKLAAVGDMNPSGNVSTSSPSGKNAAAIIAALNGGGVLNFIGIGDFQYDKGTCAALNSYWKTLWGGAITKTFFTTGPNHDVEPGVNDDVDRFMSGQCAGSTAKAASNTDPTVRQQTADGFVDALEAYSFERGAWHVVVAPTALMRYGTQAQKDAAVAWIDADLAAAKGAGKHLAAVYHDPIFTGVTASHGPETTVKPYVDVFYKYRVKVTLSGSQHNYERTCPISNTGVCVADGMTAFNVSTGGIGLRTFNSSPSYVVRQFTDTWGYLVLDLHNDGSFGWEFKPVAGGMQTDSGTRAAG